MNNFFGRLARYVSNLVGKPAAFALALAFVLAWAASGPSFHFSETWQLIINTGTTIMTFLMLFLVQNSQNRDSKSMQIKLDELLRAVHGARNNLIDIENMDEEEIERYVNEFRKMQEAYGTALKHKREKKRKHREKASNGTASG